MSASINVNSRTVVHKSSNGTSIAFPDVCKTPTGGGPVPIPYPNIAKSSDTAMGSKSVVMDNNPIMLKGSNFSTSTGDEAGSVGGVVSGTTKGKAEFINYSFDVMVEGKNVPRLGDLMLHNKAGNFNSPPTAEIQPPLPPATLNPEDDPKEEKADIKLKSPYAHEQLMLLAKELSETNFIALLIPIFGDDIPIAAYSKLYRALSDKSLTPPDIEVLKYGVRGHYAAFNSKRRKILVIDYLVIDAASDEEERQILFIALLEEYGHFIDWVLRNEYSRIGGDAKDDEGAIYAYRLAFIDIFKTDSLHFADMESDEYSGALSLDIASARAGAEKYANEKEQILDGKEGEYEYFGAGRGHGEKAGSYGHQSIEAVLLAAGFREDDLYKIYFGNWLRDFSQFVDPAVIRPGDAYLAQAQAKYKTANKAIKLAANDTNKLSRSAITKLVGILAWQEFSKENVKFSLKVKDLLMGPSGMDILGGYRPEEHIDNPFTNDTSDSSLVDPIFAKPPTPTQLAINQTTGLKNYIATATSGQSFPPAADYMANRFKKAMAAGYTEEGLRYFGEGLHVLEDYFSHSNFIEVSFIKLGYTKVVPWVKVTPNTKRIPVVTGCFGRTDVIASIGPKLANLIPHEVQDYSIIKPGERTPIDQTILIILEDLKKAQKADSTQKNANYLGIDAATSLDYYNKYLNLRDLVNSGKADWRAAWLFKAMHYSMQAFLVATHYTIYIIFHNLSHLIDDGQTLLTDIGENPTHSQLAKDHDVHHFHSIAAEIAKIAVKSVGQAMYDNIVLNKKIIDPISVAKSFMVHPLDNTHSEIDIKLRQWAAANPKKMKRAESWTVYEHLEHEGEYQITDIKKKIEEWNKRQQRIIEYFIGK